MNIKCGNLKFKITYDREWNIPQNVQKFITDGGEVELHYTINFTKNINPDKRCIISRKEDIIVARDEEYGLETRYLFIKGMYYPYAKYTELDENNISIDVLEDFEDKFNIDTMFWSLFALERHMIKRGAMSFHCAYMLYNGHAILFSGPSGIGKSTQAELWRVNREASILNGDKCLLLKENDKWCTDGWPVCGSSEICINERHKLGSIVFLKQGTENNVVCLNKMQALKRLMEQFTINYWNLEFVNEAFSLTEDILNSINVYELTCTPDVNAVEALEKTLRENESWIL